MTALPGALTIRRGAAGFTAWDELLALILASFAWMEGRIDPPSSALKLSAEGLRAKCTVETPFLAFLDGRLVGCAFLAERTDHFYLGKLAVAPGLQGRGIGRALLAAAEELALAAGKPAIVLETRVELVENHAAFARLGFRETGRGVHPGFDRPTSLTMRKVLG
jgi:GNAT superfamily N-acetyltransferase